MAMDVCPLCPWRSPLENLKRGVKPYCEKTRQNVFSKQISISSSSSETQSMSFNDISDNIKNKYKEWKISPIIVPPFTLIRLFFLGWLLCFGF